MLFLTDTHGIVTGQGKRVSTLTAREAEAMIGAGEISGGMIPKVRAAIDALDAGVSKVHVVDGRVQHALLLEIFTPQGVGTEIVSG